MNNTLSLIMNARPCGIHDTVEDRPSSSTPFSMVYNLVGKRSSRERDFFFLKLVSLIVEGISILAVAFLTVEDEVDGLLGPRDEETTVCCSMKAAMIIIFLDACPLLFPLDCLCC